MAALREQVLRTWRLVRLSVACASVTTIYPQEAVHEVVLMEDERLPSGEVGDAELLEYEIVVENLSDGAKLRLQEL